MNVPKNLKYDQTDQSSLAELLIHKQAPEGRVSNFLPGNRIDFRIPTSGGYVDSMSSSTVDFDLVLTNTQASNAAAKTSNAFFDPYLGAHQLINRIVVTVGGNIIEDTTQYPIVYKMMKALHDNLGSVEHKMALSDDNCCGRAIFSNLDKYGQLYSFKPVPVVNAANTTGTQARMRCRLNLLSCIGSLSGSKYWPSTLLDSDIRIEIYLSSDALGVTRDASLTWQLDNVELTLTRIRLNREIIETLASSANSGSVNMIMPGFSHYQETLSSGVSTNLKYSSSASSLKSIFLAFRDQTQALGGDYHPYQFIDPIGLSYQFLIGSTLMPARPVLAAEDKYRELLRCVGGPMNSTEQKMLLTNVSYNFQAVKSDSIASDIASAGRIPACHLIAQSLEMYADHTLSSVVFSGINAINLTLQAQITIASVEDASANYDPSAVAQNINKIGQTNRGNLDKNFYCDTILQFDRLLRFQNGMVTMGY